MRNEKRTVRNETAYGMLGGKGDVMNGSELIAKERKRQIEEEGWSKEHDLEQGCMTLAVAGASYVLDSAAIHSDYHDTWTVKYQDYSDSIWPFDEEWFKATPDDPVRQLVKAGALIAAEIDRFLANQPVEPTAKKEGK